jgi:hypothetical protein
MYLGSITDLHRIIFLSSSIRQSSRLGSHNPLNMSTVTIKAGISINDDIRL